MAERRGGRPLRTGPNNQPNCHRVQKQYLRPKPKPKPKPKKGATPQTKVNTSSGRDHEYAELKAAGRESVNHYELVSQATRERVPAGKVSTAPTASASQVTDRVHHAPLAVQQQQVVDLSDYENQEYGGGKEELKGKDFNRCCCCVYWKVMLGVGIIALAAFVITLMLLIIGSVGLAHARDNKESYHKLQRTSQQMGEKITTLQGQLNSSMASYVSMLEQQIVILEEQLHSSVLNLQQQLDISRGTSEIVVELQSKINAIQRNITSITSEQEANSRNTLAQITQIDNEIERIDATLSTASDSTAELTSTVDWLVSETYRLNSTVNRLDSEVNNLSMDSVALNGSLLRLNEHVIPIGCTSNVNTTEAVNETMTTSPPFIFNPSQMVSLVLS